MRRRGKARRASAPPRAIKGMRLTFRAELMPGRASGERTFTVARVLTNGRIELKGLVGQHALAEFEPPRP
ncbi:MAG TPA: hypothetical protein VF546_14275 [Pyrinomonadaceae bacterium]